MPKFTIRIKRWEIVDFLVEADNVEQAKEQARQCMAEGEGEVTADGDEVYDTEDGWTYPDPPDVDDDVTHHEPWGPDGPLLP